MNMNMNMKMKYDVYEVYFNLCLEFLDDKIYRVKKKNK